MYAFDFERPSTVAEAVAALADEDAQALGGGQTLIPTLKQRLASPSKLVSLGGIAEMKGVTIADGILTIGGGSTHAEVAAKACAPLAALAANIGDPAVRNRGTIGGSIANNDPAADYPAAMLALKSTIVTNAREIAGDDFFTGLFETALEEGEIITSVRCVIPDAANYQKFEQPASRFALVGVFVARYPDGVRVGVTGASEEGVYRWREAEQALDKDFRVDALMDLHPNPALMIHDLHGTKEYRAHLVRVMTRRAVAAC